MTEEQIEDIYNTLTGQLREEYRVPGVENLFATGSKCMNCYKLFLDAYARLCQRLGGYDEEDADVEIIVNAFMDMERIISFRMFHYGMIYGAKYGCAPEEK